MNNAADPVVAASREDIVLHGGSCSPKGEA